jgi:hypothetical protein
MDYKAPIRTDTEENDFICSVSKIIVIISSNNETYCNVGWP